MILTSPGITSLLLPQYIHSLHFRYMNQRHPSVDYSRDNYSTLGNLIKQDAWWGESIVGITRTCITQRTAALVELASVLQGRFGEHFPTLMSFIIYSLHSSTKPDKSCESTLPMQMIFNSVLPL
jgi:hypothetical protein